MAQANRQNLHLLLLEEGVLALVQNLEEVEACYLIILQVVEGAFSQKVAFNPFQEVAFFLLEEVFTLLCLVVEAFIHLEDLMVFILSEEVLFVVGLK